MIKGASLASQRLSPAAPPRRRGCPVEKVLTNKVKASASIASAARTSLKRQMFLMLRENPL